MIISNELPRLGDTSNALAGRLILLRFTRSWYGAEDQHLFDRLRRELPGILLWALAGWRRLRDRGRFVQPISGAELVEDMEALSSPVGAFVRERCIVGPDSRVEVSELYREWCSWCETHGRKAPGTDETFGRDLRAAVPELGRSRPRTSEGRLCCYTGIRLRVGTDPDPDDATPPPGQPGQCGHRDLPMHAQENQKDDIGHAEEEDKGIESTISGHCDHLDHPDRSRADSDPTRPRRRYENDDRTDKGRV